MADLKFRIPNKKKLEKSIESAGTEFAQKLGFDVRKYKIPGRRSGLDRIYIKDGFVFFIEYKRRLKRPTPAQELELNRVNAHCTNAYWCDNIDDAIRIIEFEHKKILAVKELIKSNGISQRLMPWTPLKTIRR